MFCGGDFWVESWLQRRWTEHRGVSEGQQTCRLICTWTLFPNYFFSAPSHSRVFKRKGRWPKRRKEGERHIYLHEGFLNSRRATGRSSKGDAVNVHGDGMYHSEKRGTKYYSVWWKGKTFLKNKNTLCSCLKKKTLFQRWRIWFQLMSHPCGFFPPLSQKVRFLKTCLMTNPSLA